MKNVFLTNNHNFAYLNISLTDTTGSSVMHFMLTAIVNSQQPSICKLSHKLLAFYNQFTKINVAKPTKTDIAYAVHTSQCQVVHAFIQYNKHLIAKL